MKKLLICFCLIGLWSPSIGQGLTLMKEDKIKEFKPEDVFEFSIAKLNNNEKTKCFDCRILTGKIELIMNDSLNLKLGTFMSKQEGENIRIEEQFDSKPFSSDYTIAINEIIFLKRYKSMQEKKLKSNLAVLGGLLVFTSTASALSGLIVKDKEDKNSVFLFAGIQLGIGLTSLSLSQSKKYFLNRQEAGWKL